MRFIGVDLAWSTRHTDKPETGAVAMDAAGRVVAWSHCGTDDAIVQFALDHAGAGGAIVGIDAPLVVPNERGRRVCEAELHAVGIPSYPANRTLMARLYGGARGEILTERFAAHGFVLAAEIVPEMDVQAVTEIYPRALIRRLFGTIPKYKGAKVTRGDAATGLAALEALLRERLDPPIVWNDLPPLPALPTPSDLKRRGDMLDAALSAYVCLLAWQSEPPRTETLGTLEGGFIMLPRIVAL